MEGQAEAMSYLGESTKGKHMVVFHGWRDVTGYF